MTPSCHLRVAGVVLLDCLLLHIADDGIRHQSQGDHHHTRDVEVRGQLEQNIKS